MTVPVPPFPDRSDPIVDWARRAPDRIALVDRATGARLSYAELHRLGGSWAGTLRELDIGPGDRVAALAGNGVELVGLFLGCGRVGAALVPLNWRLAAPELAVILDDADPAVVFVGPGHAGLAADVRARASGGARWLDLADAPGPLDGTEPVEPVAADPDSPVLVLYTSGTTGRPKGAVLPHRQLFYNAVATTIAWELGPDDVAPITTPLFHTGGWNVFATPLWHRGGTVVLLQAFDPDAFLQALAEERCTVALTVPTQLLMMQQAGSWGRPLPDLRFFISGGAPCPPAVAREVRDAGYRFKQGYGLTECGPNCFAISLDEAEAHPGTVGRPITFLQARRVDDEGRDVGPGEDGELLLRGPQLFGGYLADPESTRRAFTPDGWLRTGDVARTDDAGRYTICGRRKEMFISGGENVYPAEVEAALADAPGVAEVVVVGVPDEKWGEVGRAFVVLEGQGTVAGAGGAESGAAAGSEADADDVLDTLRRFAAERLARYKVPKAFIALAEIPRLGSGKPDRAALADLEPPPES